MSEQNYRTALRLLKKRGIVKTDPIKGVGTVVTITNRAIFDPFTASEVGHLTSNQPTTSHKINQPSNQPNGQPSNQPPTEGKYTPSTTNGQPSNQPFGSLPTNHLTQNQPLTINNKDNKGNNYISNDSAKSSPDIRKKLPEFEKWCRKKGGCPTEKGFNTWLKNQSSSADRASRLQPKPVAPSKIVVPDRFKSQTAEKYPARREEIMAYQTWSDVPDSLRTEWWREEKRKLGLRAI